MYHQVDSLDINVLNDTDNAFPVRYNDSTLDTHGTSCAGIIAMEKNNKECAVGIAYKSSITGNNYNSCVVVIQ